MTNKSNMESKIRQLKQTIKECQFAMIKLGAEYPLAVRLLNEDLGKARVELSGLQADYESMGWTM